MEIDFALARESDPTTHVAFVLQVRLAEFRGEISLFAKNYAIMKDQRERDDKEQRDPVVKKKAQCDLEQTKRQIHRITGESKRPVAHNA